MPRQHQIWLLLTLLSLALASAAVAQAPLINEFMAANATTIADDDGDFSDWIELYNPGPSSFDLTGCYLSDDAEDPLRWRFPAGSIPAQGFLLVWASGKDRVSPGGELHTSFAISAAGEPLLLTAADGETRLDEVAPIALATDISYGRLPDGAAAWTEFATATPGDSNTSGLPQLSAPSFSQQPGFFTSPVALELTSADPAAVIVYTLDGSEPTLLSAVYDGPLVLESRTGQPNIISLIPTNFRNPAEHYGWRPPVGEVFKINVVRARAFRPDHAPSPIITGSFIIDPDLEGQIPLPVVSLNTTAANFFADDIGIYVPGDNFIPGGGHWTGNYFETGDLWERPVHLEIFDRQGNLLLAQDAGARMHGGYSRHFPQKTFRLYARSLYGPSRFECNLFPELPYDSYNRFLIRNSGGDWGQTGFRDLAVHAMVDRMGFDTQAGRPVIHFINGEYWGLANLRERYDRHYLARCYGVPADEVALLVKNAEIEEGTAEDQAHYLALRSFVTSNDMTQPANLATVSEWMDIDNFIAYYVAQIFTANHDWPSQNVRFWRRSLPAYDPDAPDGHDGRWRWLFYDLDSGFWGPSRDSMRHATTSDYPDYPNPPWSIELFNGLLTNPDFRTQFLNTFAAHLNSTFIPSRLLAIIDGIVDLDAAAIPAWHDRWDINRSWSNDVQVMRTFAHMRPGHMRQHLLDFFDLDGLVNVSVDVNDPSMGKIQLNELLVDADLPGLVDPAQPYPWSGQYFQGVPITATAQPAPGYQFIAWQDHASSDPVLTILPGADPIRLTAIFARDLEAPIPLHAWHFNDLPAGVLTEIPADISLFGAAAITYPGSGDGYLDQVDDGTLLGALPDVPAGLALRVRNPSDTRELVLTVPSVGHDDLVLSYAVKRTTNGAETHAVHVQVDLDGPWLLIADSVEVTENHQLHAHDLAAVAGTADNPDLRLKFTFGGLNAPGLSGNQRFDNLTLYGVQIPGTNLPPQVALPPALQQLVAGLEPTTIDLATVFTDPDDDPLVFTAASDDPGVAAVSLAGNLLTVSPQARGDARLLVTASDGHHEPTPLSFRVLVHPEAAVLADGDFAFSAWDPDLPERTYPEHMLFLQSEVSDPGLQEPLLFPYFIPHDDYHADDQQTIGFPYNNTGRTRINGLGEDGISFINTGRGRDLGGALVAVDTRGIDQVMVSWLAGTVLPNDRIYAIRLQYRVGLEGAFEDLLIGGLPVEYLRHETAGDVVQVDPIVLPASLQDLPYLQLLWRYYHVDGNAGPRAELRLDELRVASWVPLAVDPLPLPQVTSLNGTAPNPFNPATEISFAVCAGESARLDIYNSRGQRVRRLGSFAAGHHRQVWDGADQQGQRLASGVYFVRLSSPTQQQTRKVLLMK